MYALDLSLTRKGLPSRTLTLPIRVHNFSSPAIHAHILPTTLNAPPRLRPSSIFSINSRGSLGGPTAPSVRVSCSDGAMLTSRRTPVDACDPDEAQ